MDPISDISQGSGALRVAPIENWLICFSGFLQHKGRLSGMQLLWSELRSRHEKAANGTRVELLEWDASADQIAEFIWRMRPKGYVPQIAIFGYSYGAGWGAQRLSRELARRGLPVKHQVLADPVYRQGCRLLSPLSLLRGWPVVVPPNVRRVSWFYQMRSRPGGHRVVAEDHRKTLVAKGVELQVSHEYMDDAMPFQMECEQVARMLVGEHVA